MKTISLFLTFILSVLVSEAQISQSQFFPGTPKFAVTVNIDPALAGPAGTNQTWDFSNLQATGEQYKVSIVSAEAFPEYSGATIAMKLESDSDIVYQVLKPLNGTLTEVGSVLSKDGVQMNTDFNNPKNLLPASIALGQSFTDSYSSSIDMGQLGLNAILKSTGTSEFIVDASGVLSLPGRTYSNVIRTVTHDVQTDTMAFEIPGFPPAFEETPKRITTWSWYSADNSGFPLVFSIVVDSSFESGNWTSDVTAFYTTTEVTGVPDLATFSAEKLPYPSQVNNVLTIPVDQNETIPSVISVTDLQGRVVGQYFPRRERENEIRIYPSNLAPGVYHIKDFRKYRREKKVISFSKL